EELCVQQTICQEAPAVLGAADGREAQTIHECNNRGHDERIDQHQPERLAPGLVLVLEEVHGALPGGYLPKETLGAARCSGASIWYSPAGRKPSALATTTLGKDSICVL